MATMSHSEVSLSLYEIEQGLADLMQACEEAEDPEAIAAVEHALAEYAEREVLKTDGIRSYVLHAQFMSAGHKSEAERQSALSKMWADRADKLRALSQAVMERHGKKRLEGIRGAIVLKGNGGLAPLAVQPEMIPDECCEYVGKIRADLWIRTLEQCPWLDTLMAGDAVKMERKIDNSAVREALKAGPVPGASLGERGSHVEIR